MTRIFATRVPLDVADLRTAGGIMLACAAVRAAAPGEPGVPCPLRSLTGVPCPFCGMTTSVGATLQLRLEEAIAANPGGVGAVVAAALLLARPPRRLSVPIGLIYFALAAMWAFELHRFSVL